MAGAPEWGCARCARIRRTCCQDTDILVTEGDLARIGEYTGLRDFWERRCPEDPEYLDQDDDPNWLVWTVGDDGTRQVLKQRADGDCTFLSPTGCVLPLSVRPLICRLHPMEYTEQGLLGIYPCCPSEAIPPGKTILETIALDEQRALCWHEILYEELRSGRPVTRQERA